MRALITGGHGFVGRHLAAHLVACGDDVAVTYLTTDTDQSNKVTLPRTVQSLALDVTSAKAVSDLIAVAQPDTIFHLAGSTFVPEAEKNPRASFDVNTFGTINVLDAVRAHAPEARVLVVSSAEVYGDPRPGTLPLNEQAPLRPVSTYGVTKAAADLMGHTYNFRHNVRAIRVRPFSHTGPGQHERFALSSFAKQVAMIKLGKAEPVIKVGNLEAKRDYSDVSDIVRGYREALLNGKEGEVYNLCSGQSRPMSEYLSMLVALAGIEVEIKEDPERVRPVEIPDLCGSYERAQKDFGWRPRVELEACLGSLLAYWIETVGK